MSRSPSGNSSGSAGSDPTTEEQRIRGVYAARPDGDERYSWLQESYRLMMHSAERGLLRALSHAGYRHLRDAEVLEVGCGTGHWLRAMVEWGVAPEGLVGIDLLGDRLTKARRLLPPSVRLATASGAALPFRDRRFDIVLQSTVFTSILDAGVRARVAEEMRRVLRPGGLILWYDFLVDNPANPNVRGMRRSEVERLFPACTIELSRVTLAPPLARALAGRSSLLAQLLSGVPFLCTHYVGVLRPQG